MFACFMLCLALAGPSVAFASQDDGGEKYAKEVASTLVGKPAPALTVTTIDGQTIDLGKLYGHKIVYLKFWATWCAPCREQMPHLEHAFETAGPDTVVIAINTNFNETREGVDTFRRKFGLKMPIVMDDGRLAEAFHLRVTPQHVVIGRDGRVAYVGHLINASLEAALAGGKSPDGLAGRKTGREGSRGAPDRLTTLDGESFELGVSASRKPRILVFMSPWCEGYLAQSQPTTGAQCRSAREQSEKLSVHSGAQWLGIASGLWSDSEALGAYRTKNKVRLPLAIDTSGDVFRRYGVKRIPTVILVDADGKEVQRLTSDMSALPALVARAARLSPGGT
nr:TlpA disulfide reductase family protein [Luteibacter yeojuensis]